MQETQEMWVQTQGQEDPLEEGMATHFSVLAWRIPTDRIDWRVTVHGVTKSQTMTEHTARPSLCTVSAHTDSV